VRATPHGTALGCPCSTTLTRGSTPASVHAPARRGRSPCAMAWLRPRLPRLWAPGLAAPGLLPAPAGPPQRLASWHAPAWVPGHRAHTRRGAGDAPRRITSACQGNAQGATHRPTSSAGHRPLPGRRQGRGQLAATGRRAPLALHVAGSLCGTPSCLGPGTVHTPQARPAPHASTRRPGPRVPARAMMPPRHRRWRDGHHARARPARESALALTTNQVSSWTPPSQGGARTRGQCIPGCLPGVPGVLLRQTWSTLDGCCSSPAPAPHGSTCDRSSSL